MATQTSDIDAVIAALRTVLKEAETQTKSFLKTKVVNRWIGQLPGAWWGRWRCLHLRGSIGGTVARSDFIGHVRATLAYLEAQRETLSKHRPWWKFSGAPKRPIARAEHAASRIAASHPEQQQADEDGEMQLRPKWLN